MTALLSVMAHAGHTVRERSTDEDWEELLPDPGDLLVAAGGDGTVRKVALAASEHRVPFAVLPIETANNVAKTLGSWATRRHWSSGGRQGGPRNPSTSARWPRRGQGALRGIRRWRSVCGTRRPRGGDRRRRHTSGARDGPGPSAAGRYRPRHGGASLEDRGRRLGSLGRVSRGGAHEHPVCRSERAAGTSGGSVRWADRHRSHRRRRSWSAPRLPRRASSPGEWTLAGPSGPFRPRRVELEAAAGVLLHVDDDQWPSDDPLSAPVPLVVRSLPGAATFLGAP